MREVPSRTGAVGDSGAPASCVELYSATTIGNRDLAFDGTVVGIAAGGTNKPGRGGLDTAAVRFRVNECFAGGTDDTVTVDMVPPANSVEQDQAPAYEQGTGMLLSGEPRWGGKPLDDPGLPGGAPPLHRLDLRWLHPVRRVDRRGRQDEPAEP